MGLLLTSTTGADTQGTLVMFAVWAVMIALMYFFLFRPQRTEQKKKAQLLSSLAVGDSVRTTGGFVGTVIDIHDNMVIVEFGNNKNCRIPMVKEAIVEVEKNEDAVVSSSDTSDSKKK